MIVSDDPPDISELPQAIAALQNEIATSSSELARSRLALTHNVTALHDRYRQVIEASIRTLEQTIHGSIARGTKAKAEYLAVVAEGMSKKLSIQYAQLMQQVYTPDMQEGLRVKVEEIEREAKAVRKQVRLVENELAEYRKVRGMEGMLREYMEILAECETAEQEIGRLKN